MEVKKGATVVFNYEVKIDDEVVDSTYETGEPLEAKIGEGQLLPAMEEELLGLKVGDKHSFELEPEKAFGHYDDDAVIEIPKSNIELRKDIQVGMYMDIQDQQKNEYRGLITEITDESVTMDFNHPLADKTLQYSIMIMAQ